MAKLVLDAAAAAVLKTALTDPKFPAALKRAHQHLRDFRANRWPEIQSEVQKQLDRFRKAGFTIADGDYLEVLEYIAAVVEVDDLKELSADNIERLAMIWLDRETMRAHLKEKAIADAILTQPLTKTDIATLFNCDRSKVQEILNNYSHQIVGTKYRMRVADMPPLYKKSFGDVANG